MIKNDSLFANFDYRFFHIRWLRSVLHTQALASAGVVLAQVAMFLLPASVDMALPEYRPSVAENLPAAH